MTAATKNITKDINDELIKLAMAQIDMNKMALKLVPTLQKSIEESFKEYVEDIYLTEFFDEMGIDELIGREFAKVVSKQIKTMFKIPELSDLK